MNHSETLLEIPLTDPSSERRAAPVFSEVGAGLQDFVDHARIFIVDDEETSIKAIAKCLKDAGFLNVRSSSQPQQVIHELIEFRPHLVLLDIRMPELDGLQVLSLIRSSPELAEVFVVMMTACDEERQIDQAFELGCADYFQKPLNPKLTALRIRNVLASQKMLHRLGAQLAKLESQVDHQAHTLELARHHAEHKYLVGKAEIATDVLHNVGNALNSVSVGVTLIKNSMKDSRLPSLKRATGLLSENAETLARYLTRDERGKLLPSYLIELSEVLLKERATVLSELELLSKHIEHINAVVATQQKYAKPCFAAERFHLAELIQDAEELLRDNLQNASIQINRYFEPIPPVNSDRQKLLQVVLNLMKNAIDAIRHSHPKASGQIDICLVQRKPEVALLSITDNGIGILKEHLRKIFVHGFTTKEDGHGFGLHGCANMIKDLGGSIHVSSNGLGQGATFAIELPFESLE